MIKTYHISDQIEKMADVEGTEKQPCVEVTAETKTDSPTFSNPEEETKLDINENGKIVNVIAS